MKNGTVKSRLGPLCVLISSGSTPLGGETVYLESGPVALIRSQNVRMNALDLSDVAFISEEINNGMRRSVVARGDVLLNITGASIGRVAYFDSEQRANVNQHVCIIRPKPGVLEPRYLTYFLSSPEIQHDINYRHQHGGTRQALTFSQIADFEIPTPSIFDQRRIADILDEVDSLRKKRAEAIGLANDLVPSIFNEMFGDLKSNHRCWPEKSIGQFAEVGTGTTPSRANPTYFGGTIPWVKTTEVQGVAIHDTEEKLTQVGFTAARSKLYPINSIVVALYGQGKTRGQVARLAIPAATNQACAVILPSSTYETDYLLTVLHLAYETLRSMSRGGNQQNLNLELIRSFRFPFAPIELQRKFSNTMIESNSVLSQQKDSGKELDGLFNSLLQRAFRGTL